MIGIFVWCIVKWFNFTILLYISYYFLIYVQHVYNYKIKHQKTEPQFKRPEVWLECIKRKGKMDFESLKHSSKRYKMYLISRIRIENSTLNFRPWFFYAEEAYKYRMTWKANE